MEPGRRMRSKVDSGTRCPMRVNSLDHLVLTVADLEITTDFYSRVLGMEVVTFGEGRTAIAFGDQKINLHQRGKEFEPKAISPTPGSGDLCFISDVPLSQVQTHLAAHGVDIEVGPVGRIGARGPMTSIYIRDPDGNLIEIANY
jgi:catechol 2,3-dioxygenase-like lactoylglutathione lyase family enzyme